MAASDVTPRLVDDGSRQFALPVHALGLPVMVVWERNETDLDSMAAKLYQPVQRNRAHFVHSCFSSLDVARRRTVKNCLEYRVWGVVTDR